jgi:sRNA-binding protein
MSKGSRKQYQQKRQLWRQAEILRGMNESREGIAMLQSLWPAAFPEKFHQVRPLASGIMPAIVERTGWSRGYARGVVHVWKARNAYCTAVLCYDKRFDLNGGPVDQTVDDSARIQARRLLAARKARIEARNRKAAAERVDISADFAKTGENSQAA